MRCYVTLLENDCALLPFFVEWYRRQGATEFPTLVYGDKRLHEVAKTVVGDGYSRLGTFHPSEFSARGREAVIASQHPRGEWAFFCDLDEFCEPLPASYRDYPFVEGSWVDRCGPGGALVSVQGGVPLETQFPCAASRPLHARMNFGGPVYVAAPFGPRLHHPNACKIGRGLRKGALRVRVHHFKWQKNVVARLEARIARMKPDQTSWRAKVQRQLNHLSRFGGVNPKLVKEVGSVLGV